MPASAAISSASSPAWWKHIANSPRRPASLRDEIRAAEESLGCDGRVLVRFSGAEPLARVMVEGLDEAALMAIADRMAGAIRAELG